jgi:hypothetical protein
VLGAVAALALLAPDGGEGNENALPTGDDGGGPTDDALVSVVPPPADLAAAPAAGGAVFSWTNPDPQEGDSYLWQRTDPGAETGLQRVDDPRVVVPGAGRMCIEVVLVRSNGRESADPAEACTP